MVAALPHPSICNHSAGHVGRPPGGRGLAPVCCQRAPPALSPATTPTAEITILFMLFPDPLLTPLRPPRGKQRPFVNVASPYKFCACVISDQSSNRPCLMSTIHKASMQLPFTIYEHSHVKYMYSYVCMYSFIRTAWCSLNIVRIMKHTDYLSP